MVEVTGKGHSDVSCRKCAGRLKLSHKIKSQTKFNTGMPLTLRKHAFSNILNILQPKKENFQLKMLIFSIILLKT